MAKAGDKYIGELEFKRKDGEYDAWTIIKRGGIYLIGTSTNTGLLSDYYYQPGPGESEQKSLEEINADLEVLATDGENYMSSLERVPKKRTNPVRRRKRCWRGYRPVPGMKPYSKGSCVKVNPFRVGGYPRETPEEAGYRVVQLKGRQLILEDKADGKLELWGKSPNFAGYAIYYKNTTWEFVRSLPRQNPIKGGPGKIDWVVWTYDVWGNAKDGWDVNDRFRVGKIVLTHGEENVEEWFNKAMIREGMNVRWKDIDNSISSEDVIYFRREKDGMPLGEITREL